MTTVAIIVAAGKGIRAGGKVPKQWRTIAGKPVIDWSIDAFINHKLRQKYPKKGYKRVTYRQACSSHHQIVIWICF